jgi:hypothetical protein
LDENGPRSETQHRPVMNVDRWMSREARNKRPGRRWTEKWKSHQRYRAASWLRQQPPREYISIYVNLLLHLVGSNFREFNLIMFRDAAQLLSLALRKPQPLCNKESEFMDCAKERLRRRAWDDVMIYDTAGFMGQIRK